MLCSPLSHGVIYLTMTRLSGAASGASEASSERTVAFHSFVFDLSPSRTNTGCNNVVSAVVARGRGGTAANRRRSGAHRRRNTRRHQASDNVSPASYAGHRKRSGRRSAAEECGYMRELHDVRPGEITCPFAPTVRSLPASL